MAFGSESDNSESDGSTSPEPDDPDYALSGPHVHNEMTLESKWPFSNVFESESWARTCPYLIETTSDRICFFVRSLPGPKGDFFSLGIDTKGHKHSHVLLFQFILVSDWTHSRYKTKRYIVHFSLKDSFWLNKTFLSVEEANNWFQIARNENVTFVMSFKYNIDHDFICHEPGHVKTRSCRLAKKRFKKCPPKRMPSPNNMLLPSVSNSSGGFPGMVKVRDERDQPSRALVKLPPFDTLLKKPNIGELVGSNVNWLMPKPSPMNMESFVSDQRLMNWNARYMLPIISRAAGQLEGCVRAQDFALNRELQELAHLLLKSQWGGRKIDSVPRLSYHTPGTEVALESTTYQPPVSYATPGTSGWRPPERTTAPVWSGPNAPNRTIGPSVSVLHDIPTSAPANFHLSQPPQLTKTNRHQPARRRARRRIIITCGNDRFFINSKILEDASPVVKAFMRYWTPLPDPNGDIFLEIAGVTSIALENLLKYLTNDSFNHGVMRSTHMKELTRKLKIDINLF